MIKRSWWMWPALSLVSAAIVWVVVFFLTRSAPNPVASTNSSVTARAAYAALYDAAWRSDSSQGNIVVTATLMVPSMINTLAQDTGRSESENQLLNAAQSLSDHQLGIFLTIDSVNGAVGDETITTSAQLTADRQVFTTTNWAPFIGTSHVVNTSQSTTYQSGLLTFSNSTRIDWAALRNLKLSMRSLDDQPDRQFIWAQPQLLLPAPE